MHTDSAEMFVMTALETVPTPFHAGLLNKRLPFHISLGPLQSGPALV